MLEPTRVGPLQGATHVGNFGRPGDGPYVVIWLRIVCGIVEDAAWSSNGCPAMIASASAVAELSVGKDTSYLSQLSPEDVTNLIGQLPEGKGHAPSEALEALRLARENEVA